MENFDEMKPNMAKSFWPPVTHNRRSPCPPVLWEPPRVANERMEGTNHAPCKTSCICRSMRKAPHFCSDLQSTWTRPGVRLHVFCSSQLDSLCLTHTFHWYTTLTSTQVAEGNIGKRWKARHASRNYKNTWLSPQVHGDVVCLHICHRRTWCCWGLQQRWTCWKTLIIEAFCAAQQEAALSGISAITQSKALNSCYHLLLLLLSLLLLLLLLLAPTILLWLGIPRAWLAKAQTVAAVRNCSFFKGSDNADLALSFRDIPAMS